MKSDNPQAVDSALTCLRLFNIDIPAHPTWEQVKAEYEAVWPDLEKRPIEEELIDLPLMTDPELLAAMRLLSDLDSPAYFTDFHLFCVRLCRMMGVGLRHGTSGAFAHGCAAFGMFLGPVFHRYREGYRFAKLACDVIEKHGFMAHHAKVHVQMGEACLLGGADRDRARFQPEGLSQRDRDRGSDLRLLQHLRNRRLSSRAERSARGGVARNGDRPGFRPEIRIPRCRRYRRQPAAFCGGHARADG